VCDLNERRRVAAAPRHAPSELWPARHAEWHVPIASLEIVPPPQLVVKAMSLTPPMLIAGQDNTTVDLDNVRKRSGGIGLLLSEPKSVASEPRTAPCHLSAAASTMTAKE
jgi:hypothetical protein